MCIALIDVKNLFLLMKKARLFGLFYLIIIDLNYLTTVTCPIYSCGVPL